VRTFECACGARVFFENTQCLSCSRELGFALRTHAMLALEPRDGGHFVTPLGSFRKCGNYAEQGVCNWLVPADAEQSLCEACRLNNVIPDLSVPENRALWAEVERAKRRLVYTLAQLDLPLVPKSDDPQHGLAFDIKADTAQSRVLTGHDEGLITLNLAEADAPTRERVRADMRERYRTLLGHFRHESGHYFWERLIRDRGKEPSFRELFGDETVDYAQSLAAHYARSGGNTGWNEAYISTYASSHPWEDWAETFAHYLHMIDTLETAQHFGLTSLAERRSVPRILDFEPLLSEWTELTVALNALNRSMGLPDAYPFAISALVARKLAFVHATIHDRSRETAKGTGREDYLISAQPMRPPALPVG
jgi:hypothetical protein